MQIYVWEVKNNTQGDLIPRNLQIFFTDISQYINHVNARNNQEQNLLFMNHLIPL